jgi:hypothetical protein
MCAVFATLGPAFDNLTYFSLSVVNLSQINAFILMLVNFWQDLNLLRLARFCDVSECTAHNIFIAWVNICSRQLSEINTWADEALKIIERSGLPSMCDASDSVMADNRASVCNIFCSSWSSCQSPTYVMQKTKTRPCESQVTAPDKHPANECL